MTAGDIVLRRQWLRELARAVGALYEKDPEVLGRLDLECSRTFAWLEPLHYLTFDQHVRSTFMGHFEWIYKRNLLHRAADLSSYSGALFGALSCCRDGYARQELVKQMGKLDDEPSMLFLLIRCSDHVPAVRMEAERSLASRTLRILPRHVLLFQRLVQQRRLPAAHLLKALEAGGTTYAVSQIGSNDTEVALEAAKVLVESLREHLWVLLESRNPAARRIALKELGSTEVSREQLLALAGSRFPDVRAAALRKLIDIGGDQLKQALQLALFDSSGAVRSVAQFELGKQGMDVCRLAAEAEGQVRRANWIAAVGESCGLAESELIAPHLASEFPSVRRAAIKALARLDTNRWAAEITFMVLDGSSSVSRAALQVAWQSASPFPIERFLWATEGEQPLHVKKHAIALLHRRATWPSLPHLLRLSRDEALRPTIERWLGAWVRKPGANLLKPSGELLTATEAELSSAVLDPRIIRPLKDMVDYWKAH